MIKKSNRRRINESLDFNTKDNLTRDLYHAMEKVMIKYKRYDITEDDFYYALEEAASHFCEDSELF